MGETLARTGRKPLRCPSRKVGPPPTSPDREVRALQTRAVGLTVAMVAQMIVA
jgi:hypothetical protein